MEIEDLTPEQKQQVIDEHYRQLGAKRGRVRSPAKLKAARENIKKALAIRWGRPLPKKRKKKK